MTTSCRTTAGLVRERPTPVTAIVADALDRVAPLAAARAVVLDTDLGDAAPAQRLRCDPAALSRALGNLLENAIQASPGGSVCVSLAGAGDDVVSLELLNEPASVPPAVRGALFERAVTARSRGGSGLGLAIARAAIKAHGGRVRFVEMGPPRVRVRVELPCG
jgi:signal transduction histidine kinase